MERDHVCATELNVALFFPRLHVHSGGVERTLKIMENAHRVGIRFTVFTSDDVIRAAEVQRRLEELEVLDRISLQADRHGTEIGESAKFDAVVLPSEFWIPANKRALATGIRAPLFIEFHQLPYIGTLDVLKVAGLAEPTLVDFVRFPVLASRLLGGSSLFFAAQMVACLDSVRRLRRLSKAGLMAVTAVTKKGLQQFGYKGPMYVPEVHVGLEPDPFLLAMKDEVSPEYDGVYVGRFHPHKGFLDLPRIVARLKDRWKSDVRVAVCGTPQFGRHLSVFQEQVDALGIRDNIVMLRFLPRADLYTVMRKSRMLIYPSYVDAFSITTLESLGLGLPIVAYDIDAMSMIWGSEPGVFLSRVGEPERLADLCAELARSSTLDEARQNAERRVPELLRKYSWERAVAFERAFYDASWEGAG